MSSFWTNCNNSPVKQSISCAAAQFLPIKQSSHVQKQFSTNDCNTDITATYSARFHTTPLVSTYFLLHRQIPGQSGYLYQAIQPDCFLGVTKRNKKTLEVYPLHKPDVLHHCSIFSHWTEQFSPRKSSLSFFENQKQKRTRKEGFAKSSMTGTGAAMSRLIAGFSKQVVRACVVMRVRPCAGVVREMSRKREWLTERRRKVSRNELLNPCPWEGKLDRR